MNLLSNKIALVTGGGRGIGRGQCLHLAKSGASVLVNDIDLAEAKKVAEEIKGFGGKARTSAQDISSRSGAERLIEECVNYFGTHIKTSLEDNADNWADYDYEDCMDGNCYGNIHVKGTFWCSQAASLVMKQKGEGGSIVNTTSGAHFGNFGQTNYSAAKGAITTFPEGYLA